MSPSVITDYEALCKFRGQLLDLVENLQTQLKKTEQAMDEVAEVWDDLQFKKYHDEFTKDMEIFPPLCQRINAFESDVLYPLEQIIREYLDM